MLTGCHLCSFIWFVKVWDAILDLDSISFLQMGQTTILAIYSLSHNLRGKSRRIKSHNQYNKQPYSKLKVSEHTEHSYSGLCGFWICSSRSESSQSSDASKLSNMPMYLVYQGLSILRGKSRGHHNPQYKI